MRYATITRLSVAVAAALTVSTARAAVYTFDYESGAGLSAKGEITVDAAGEVTAISGEISGLVNDTIAAIVANSNYPAASYSPDGAFIYDNAYLGGSQPLDIDGVLFTTASNAGGYWNLWGNSPDNYSLWESVPGSGYPIATSGTLAIAGAPEAPTWAMMILGVASLGYAASRRRRREPVAAFAA
jgi:MYXO-CTERM domain-containing protein